MLFGGAADGVCCAAYHAEDHDGAFVKDATIVVDGLTIRSIGRNAAKPTYDLSGLTAMPGWIDTHVHVHIGWHYNREGRASTLMAGFTTVQSLGASSDRDLRDLIEAGIIPGPRLLTSREPLSERSGTPEQIRARAAAGDRGS